MSQYMIRGSNVFVGSELDMQVHQKLPVGTYVVCIDPQGQYFLTVVPDMSVPDKLYGNTTSMADRFINTYRDRKFTTGVLLSGAKGSGKSLLMKQASIAAATLGIPTLVVNTPFYGDNFNKFIQSISCDCVIIFDEFEKVFDNKEQEALLTLLDGSYPTHKLVIMTCNDKYRINDHFINRPGRLFYHLKYSGLDEAFIREYCADKLDDQSKVQSIVSLSNLFTEFNFDMLSCLVEELNRYKESVKEVVEIINVNYAQESGVRYNVEVILGSEKLAEDRYYPQVVNNPLHSEQFFVNIYGSEEDDVNITLSINVFGENTKVSPDLSTLEIDHGEYKIKLTKHVDKQFNFGKFF